MPTFVAKKLCLVAISLGKGGAERSVALLSKMLSQLGHEVHIVILNNQIDQDYSGILFNLGKLKEKNDGFLKRLSRFKKLKNYIQKNKFDVVIDHRPKNNLNRERFYSKYIYPKVKKIDVVHSALQAKHFDNFGKGLIHLFNANAASVAVSEYIQKQILEPKGIKNVVHIPNCADPTWLNEKNNLPDILKNKNYFLSYGRIEDHVKDLRFLIFSFTMSKLWKENFVLVIMGDGRDKDQLINEVASTGMQTHIIFLPHCASPSAIIKHAKAVCLTSNYEGFPMVLVESLSLETPAISLDIPSGPSQIIQNEKNGILVKNRIAKDFSEALKKMALNQSFYLQCKSNAQKSVEKFTMQAVSVQWNSLIEKVCAQNKIE